MNVLCIGNGGVVVDEGRVFTHRPDVAFVAELASLGMNVRYCGWEDSANDPLSQAPLSGVPGVEGRALPRVGGGGFGGIPQRIRALSALVRELRWADTVYIYWPGRLASIAATMCRLMRKPYGLYFRGELVESHAAFARAFQGADYVIAAGEALRQRASAHCREVENVTPMTALRSHHLSPPKRHEAREPWRLLFVGRIERRKGSFDLVAAMEELGRLGIPAQLTLVGHCPDPSALLGATTPDVAARITMPGAIGDFEELAAIYRASDIFVFPSHDEGFPRVLYEAMAFGLPIVTTFVGSIDTVMRDGENCLRVPVGAPPQIAHCIDSLVRTPAVYDRVAEGGARTVATLMEGWRMSHAQQVASRVRGGSCERPEGHVA